MSNIFYNRKGMLIKILVIISVILTIESFGNKPLYSENNSDNGAKSFVLEIYKSGDSPFDLQLTIPDLKIVKGKKYCLKFSALCSNEIRIPTIKLTQNNYPWNNNSTLSTGAAPKLDDKLRTYSVSFLANKNDNTACIKFYLGGLKDDRGKKVLLINSVRFEEIGLQGSSYTKNVDVDKIKLWTNKGVSVKRNLSMDNLKIENYRQLVEIYKDADNEVRIMPLGDSLTSGYPGSDSYRACLLKLLKQNKFNVNFVGSQSDGTKDLPDKDHEGHGGYTSSQLEGCVYKWIDQFSPQIVLLLIGTNDMCQNVPPEVCSSNIGRIIENIMLKSKGIRVFVSSIPPLGYGTKINNNIVDTNNLIKSVIEAEKSKGFFVRYVDGGSLVSVEDLYKDHVHINPDSGANEKLAAAWDEALEDSVAELN